MTDAWKSVRRLECSSCKHNQWTCEVTSCHDASKLGKRRTVPAGTTFMHLSIMCRPIETFPRRPIFSVAPRYTIQKLPFAIARQSLHCNVVPSAMMLRTISPMSSISLNWSLRGPGRAAMLVARARSAEGICCCLASVASVISQLWYLP